ncbi:RsmB/NOP family class I SAM-dependent RNA methyltransferase [Parvularcula sp. IMCC14364]|uniref:RsmB/NOP family class I SAM-dependent RNA methyltransferase n=1 Tax=Parvularcula sp. IMCC14364 TaxID=3067902 RepID=UPI00274040A5|nr:RsmB/NOP family class I SAM-dependent RNA methyltransferase [Parvularcula sp. IMCC14364]
MPERDGAADPRKGRAIEQLEALEEKMPGLAARRAALDILMLLRKGRTLDNAFSDCRTFSVLEGPDRSFAFNLVNTTLRRRGSLDQLIGEYLNKPLPKGAMEVQDILRLAATQAAFLETPAHAIAATSAELAGQKRETAGYKGLVNAIARKIAGRGKAQIEKLPLRADTPGWLWRSWERYYGATTAREIAAAHLAGVAPLDISLKPEADPDLFAGFENVSSFTPSHRRLPPNHAVPSLPGFNQGNWWVQDFASSLPVTMLGEVSGKQVLDLCAAPGGKTMQLAALGAQVTAVDNIGTRLKRVTENLARTKLSAETLKADILEWQPEALVDAVLLDAPCSATGTIRRHPDVVWNRTEDEVRTLARQQGTFIDRALEFLKPGGLLVYCVCSLQREEGEDQVRAALSRHQGLELVPLTREELTALPEAVTREGYLRTHPAMRVPEGSMDGFFAARLRKPSAPAAGDN